MKLPEIMRAARRGYQPGRYKARLAIALALSLLIHGLILTLRFGIAGFGLPGLAMPWAERRAHSWDLSVRLAERPTAPAVALETVLAPLAVRPPAAATPAVRERPKPARPPRVEKSAEATPPAAAPAALSPLVAEPPPLPPREIPEPAPAPEQKRDTAIPKPPQPEIIAQQEAEQETFAVPPPAEPRMQRAPDDAAKEQAARVQAEAERQAKEQEALRLEETKRLEAARKLEEARKLEQAQAEREAQELEARRQAEEASRIAALAREAEEQARRERDREEARRAALELEARRKAEEAARQQALALERQKEEALRLEETRREEEARQARIAMELEAQRKSEEAARQHAAELARQRELEARRQAEELAARQRAQELAERQRAEALAQSERERLAAERAASRTPLGAEGGRPAGAPSAPVTPSGRDLAAKALEQLRSPGAARGEPQRPRAPFDFPEPPRRRSILGGIDRDVGVRMYIESWRAKIERNGNLNIPPSARTRSHEDPIVTVAVRSDGSLESVFIHRSSGLREVDDAVRRIAQLYSPYSAFPPALARAYDVIEIRHIWYFADRLRLLEEMR